MYFGCAIMNAVYSVMNVSWCVTIVVIAVTYEINI